MLLDAQGREIVRVKQYGFVRREPEYGPPPPAPKAECDAIASHAAEPEELALYIANLPPGGGITWFP